MEVQRYAAFSDGSVGGNPAGVAIVEALPGADVMQRVAADIGYSETAFAAPTGEGGWRVRYFAPVSEVPFCGHATIALGAALARAQGDGVYDLNLNDGAISVEGWAREGALSAALLSPPTSSRLAEPELVEQALSLFGYRPSDLDDRLAPALATSGATFLVLALRDRSTLARLEYDQAAGKVLMDRVGVTTIDFVHIQSESAFACRNAFASGGIYEDPATGAAAAAFIGRLRDLEWPHQGDVSITQGEDMGMTSILTARLEGPKGAPVRVAGAVRIIEA